MQSFPIDLMTGKGAVRYPSPGRCLYCPATTDLREEHIVPFGLAGHTIVMDAASCLACERITGPLEQQFLRRMLGPIRIKINAPTRNPRERPTHLEMRYVLCRRLPDGRLEHVGDIQSKTIPVKAFPMAFLGLHPRPPGILWGIPPAPGYDGTFFIRYDEDAIANFIAAEIQPIPPGIAAVGVSFSKVSPSVFRRVLAKFAHGYAVAMLGFDGFSPVLPDVILGRSQHLGYYVGGDGKIPPPIEDRMFDMILCSSEHSGRRYALVEIRLFPFFETPLYVVVAGELTERGEEKLALMK